LELGVAKQFELVHFWHARGGSDNHGLDSVSGVPNVFVEAFFEKLDR
jgi:hypothetical protein